MGGTLFLIFGLNRGGTSVLAGSLRRCGVGFDFGREGLEAHLHKPDATRPDGGYESHEVPAVLELVRQVAERSGGHQNNPPLPEELRFSALDAVTVASLVRLIPSFPFGIKDPLLTFQYRHWKSAITAEHGDLSVVPLVSLRPPLDLAHALLKRGFCRSLRSGLDLWLRYYSEVWHLERTGESPRILLYDGAAEHYLRQIEALCDEHGLEYAEGPLRELFRPGRGHHHHPSELERHPLASTLQDLYAELESRSLLHARGTAGRA